MTESPWQIEHRLLSEKMAGRSGIGMSLATSIIFSTTEPLRLGAFTVADTDPINLGPYFCENPHHALLHYALGGGNGNLMAPEQPIMHDGIALEFGVGDGASLRCISRYLPVIGFDWFGGLPEDWRPGFPEGMFKFEGPLYIPQGTRIVEGLFEDSLPDYQWDGLAPIRLVHIDCDLYSSTKTVLEHLPWRNMIQNKAVIVFDEFHGFPDAEVGEQRAWRELDLGYDLQYEVIGHGEQSWGIKLT